MKWVFRAGLVLGLGCGSAPNVGGDTSETESAGPTDGSDSGASSVGGDSGPGPCAETRAFLTSLDAMGGEQWSVEWEEQSRGSKVAVMADGSVAHAILGTIQLRDGEGGLITTVPAMVDGATTYNIHDLQPLGDGVLAGGRADYQPDPGDDGERTARLDRYDGMLVWQEGLEVGSRSPLGEGGVSSMAADGNGGVYLHGDICAAPCVAWAEHRDGALDLLWREEYTGSGGDVAATPDGNAVVALQDFADAESPGARLLSYSADGAELWSHAVDGKIGAITVREDGFVIAFTYGGSGNFLEAHDESGRTWQQPAPSAWALAAYGPSGFIAAGRREGEGWLALHDADADVQWDYVTSGDAVGAGSSVEDFAVAPDGSIVAAGFVSMSCEWGSTGG